MEKKMIRNQKITPCLWFTDNAEEAVILYTSVFKNSKIIQITHYGKNAPMPEGTVLTIVFQLEGTDYLALNGGPAFSFNEAVSFSVSCDTQEEIDYYWAKLSEGGTVQQCGWLKDRFGLSWQIVPSDLGKLMYGAEPERSARVMQALLQMVKLDIGLLKKAYEG